jgi:hypothetical protein
MMTSTCPAATVLVVRRAGGVVVAVLLDVLASACLVERSGPSA